MKKRINRKTNAASVANITCWVNKSQKKVQQSNSKDSVDVSTLVPVLQQMSREQLKGLLREQGLSISGNKTNMINRLKSTMIGNANTVRRTKDTISANGSQSSTVKQPLVLDNTRTNKSSINADDLTLWQHPVLTLTYFFRELFINILSLFEKILHHKKCVWSTVIVTILFLTLSRISGPQQEMFKLYEAKLLWGLYWVGLGVLSSVGLGTGLHTFVLYLGPHIAAVTMAAYECGALNFPEPPYPDSIVCPPTLDPSWTASVLNIMRKVRIEAMLWGAGTALGELPPYFMARAARISHRDHKNEEDFDQEDLKELEALEAMENGEDVPLMTRLKLAMKHFVQKAGFWGILACASIPNPLFDLAGLTCGHYLIPFWTFFGATLIGKAVIKMHIQQLAVIIAFNEELLDKFINLLSVIPFVGSKFQKPLKKYLLEQKQKLHSKESADGTTMISWLFDKFIVLMICYFLITIIHALARNHYRRQNKPAND